MFAQVTLECRKQIYEYKLLAFWKAFRDKKEKERLEKEEEERKAREEEAALNQ